MAPKNRSGRASSRQQRLDDRRGGRTSGGSDGSGRSGPGGSGGSGGRNAAGSRSGILGRLSRVNPILLWTGVGVVVAVVVVAAALVLTQPKSYSASDFTSPIVVTPATIQSSGHTLGATGAPVTVDLYEDFRCTGCGGFYRSQEPQLVDNYVATGKAKIVYHDFTIIDNIQSSTGTHASRDAANAGLCAVDASKFWTYHDWLFTNQSSTEDPSAFTIDRLVALGKAAGIDDPSFETCVRQGQHNADVAAEQSAVPSGVTSTPTIYVNGTVVLNKTDPVNYQPTYDDIAAAIDAALQ